MKKIQLTLFVNLYLFFGFAQNYQAEFDTYFTDNDTLNQLKTLKKWQLKSPNDAELFTSYFNYHFVKSKRKILALTKEQPSGESFYLKDSSNHKAGFIGTQIHYDTQELKKGFDVIEKGIQHYPNRLDMRFGKIYVYGLVSDWDNFTSEIIKTIEQSSKNNNKWTWTNNTAYEGGVDEFLLDIQDYQLKLYNTGNDDLLLHMRKIASKVLEYYPNHVESLSNLSITYLLTQQYDKGITYLLKAEKIKPTDYIVLGNIAQAYKLKGNTEKSIEYYKKVVEFGDDDAQSFAKQEIEKLNSNRK